MNVHNTSSVVPNPEPLYLLAEDNNDVSVTNYLMQDHQVDGLRFLFKQFNKKSPGVIVNFPASCGKSATVAVFLNAVSNVLKNPILILCKDDGGIQYWKETLVQWSSYVEDDIALEASNPKIKGKKVFLKKCENLYSYVRRRWSIVIIKENVINKDIFKISFEADFKICITATDIKKDLSLLTAVFSWLYPQKVINFNDFVAKENRPKEKFRKSVQLDFLLEDVAIRRYVNLKPFQMNEKAGSVKEIETAVTEIAKNVTEVENHQTEQMFKVNRSKQVKNEQANEISGQAFILIHDHVKTIASDQNYNSNLINDQLLNRTSDQDIILINDDDDDILNKKISTLDDSSYQNVIFINDDQIPTQTTDHNVIFINDDQTSIKLSQKYTLDDPTNQNVILIDEQFVNKTDQNNILVNDQVTSIQNVIFINNDQILNQTLDENIIFRNDHILNKISHNGTLNKSLNENLIFIEEPTISKADQNIILIDDHGVVNKTARRNNFLINDDHFLNQTSDKNDIFINYPSLNGISNDNLFLMNENKVHESFTQDLISLDKKILNKTSNVLLLNHQKLKKKSDQHVVLPNDYNKINVTLDENVIIIDDDDENETNINKNYVSNVRNPISIDNPPIVNENNDVDRVNIHNVSIDRENKKLHKINSYKSTINKKFETSEDYDSCKLDVNNYILEQKPINREYAPSRLHYKRESKITGISESLGIENDSKIDLSEKKDLDDKDLLKEQLMASLHINDSINDLNKIKNIEESLIKEEPTETVSDFLIKEEPAETVSDFLIKEEPVETVSDFLIKEETVNTVSDFLIKEEPAETESSNVENNSKVDVNKIKVLRNQLLESLGLDRDGKFSVNEIKNSANKNTSKVDPNNPNDLSNKYLLQKQLFESLGFNSACQEIQKSVKENNIELNESKNIEDTLIKEESINSLSFGTKSKDKKDMENLHTHLIKEESTETLSFVSKPKLNDNDLRELDTNLIKNKSPESLNFGNNSKEELNEMKDLRNRNVLQKQLIESLGLDNLKNEIKDEIKEEATDETSSAVENTDNVVVSNKRKSDEIEKNIDFKILDLEEKALKKFKGSILDSLF